MLLECYFFHVSSLAISRNQFSNDSQPSVWMDRMLGGLDTHIGYMSFGEP